MSKNLEEFKEKEIMPGVYLTDFRRKDAQPSSTTIQALADPRSVLDAIELDIQELENSIKHLKRSNIEMEEYLRTDPDEDIKNAIEENVIIMLKREKQILQLRELKEQQSGQHYNSMQDLQAKYSALQIDKDIKVSIPDTDDNDADNSAGIYL
jgi:hypothetical protein